jgi:GNAT superfamily N-acetyltransferase
VSFVFELATESDAAAVAALRLAAARDLAMRFGEGPWSAASDTAESLRLEVHARQTYVGRRAGTVVATLRLSPNNPWLCETGFFTPRVRPLFLTAMAVLPRWQRCGVGRACLAHVERIAVDANADAIRLDAHDAPAGAAEFYRKCGFREVHRGSYHGSPLIWFERLL